MARIKAFGIAVPRSDITREEFHDHWRHPHGTWGRNLSTARGYVQSHQIDTDLLGPEQSRCGGVAELWFDNAEDLQALYQELVYVKYLQADELLYTDVPKCTFFATEEEVLTSGPQLSARLNAGDELWSPTNRPFSIKLLHFIGPDADPQWARTGDQELGLRLGALRHVRCHALSSYHRSSPPFLGVQELWWPTVSAFRSGIPAARDAWTTLLAPAGQSVTLLVQAERFL